MSYQPNSGSKVYSQSVHRLVAFLLSLTMLGPMTAFGQDDKRPKEEQKKQERAVRAELAESKRQGKRERRYAKIKAFALDKYNTDEEFKDIVDDRYRQVRENQTREAYAINTRPSNYKLVNRDGEKLRFDHTLYDNPLAQDYVNRVGQALVPTSSTKLFAFKILQNPVPEARSLSTGTIYVSTGYLALIDNEAQLAYILAHEIAHVERNHWFEDILVDVGTEPYMEKKPLIGFLRSFARQAQKTELGVAVANVLKVYGIDETFQWETIQEDEADTDAMKYMFDRNYDVREIPKFYARMQRIAADSRSQTGFIADPNRIRERLSIFQLSSQQFVNNAATLGAVDLASGRNKKLAMTGARGIARMLHETLQQEIKKRLEAGELKASGEEFQSVMAMVKRDNGIRAFQFDMFEMARNNLEDSINIRGNDPAAYYYFGKVLKQTARNAAETSRALENLNRAIDEDKRQTIAEPYLFRALLRLGERNPNEATKITQDLQTYVTIYQRENGGSLPTNMEFVYDIMQDFEVLNYRATPAMNTADAPKPVGAAPRSTVAESAPPVETPSVEPIVNRSNPASSNPRTRKKP